MRTTVYTGLLLFIILAGTPMLAVPHLRQRLFDRVRLLHEAWTTTASPAIQSIGADAIPYPKEFERPTVQAENTAALKDLARSALPAGTPDRADSPIKTIKFLDAVQKGNHDSLTNHDAADAENAFQEESDSAPVYRQDKNAREAYEIVLKANRKLADMVRGTDSALHLKTWGAAHRGNDVYWVRVVFLNRERAEAEYIWEVRLASKEASPLSFNARSIS